MRVSKATESRLEAQRLPLSQSLLVLFPLPTLSNLISQKVQPDLFEIWECVWPN